MLLAAHFNVCMQAQLICEVMNQAVRVTSSAFYDVCMQAQLICEGMNQAVRVTSSAF